MTGRWRRWVVATGAAWVTALAVAAPAGAAGQASGPGSAAASASPPAAAGTDAPTSPAAASGSSAGGVLGGPLLAGRGLFVPAHPPRLPTGLTGRGWLLADLDTGDVLAARNPHGRYLPASTLKLLTAVTLLPRLNPHAVVVANDEDCTVDGTRVGLVPSGRYTVDVLFQALLMMSGNDAANALARAAGGVSATVALMNATARHLQADDTHAATPSGLDGPDESTSAYDLALIARADFARPEFRHYDEQLSGQIPAQPPKYPAFAIANQNTLLYEYPGALGGKNGYTDAARHTYVGAAARHGRRLVVTFLYAERQPTDLWQQAASLLDWGFGLPAGTAPVGHLVGPATPASPRPAPTARLRPAAAAAGGGRRELRLLPVSAAAGGAVVALGIAGAALLIRRRRAAGRFHQPQRWT